MNTNTAAITPTAQIRISMKSRAFSRDSGVTSRSGGKPAVPRYLWPQRNRIRLRIMPAPAMTKPMFQPQVWSVARLSA